MATGAIELSIPPHAVDGTNPPGLRYEDHRWEMLFDSATDEICYWSFRVPHNYASGPLLKIQYKMASAVAGDAGNIFGVEVAVMAQGVDEAVDMDTPSFDTVNAAEETIPATTAGIMSELSVTLTNADSMAALEHVTLKLNRDVSVTNDALGDAEVVGVTFEYTTT
jgi:hypothetical protein